MIEVEKKFQPTNEQLAKLLEGTEFLGEKNLEDEYYDYPDFRICKKDWKFRIREGVYELKVNLRRGSDAEHNEEFDNEEEILEKLGFDKTENLGKIVKEKMVLVAVLKNNRKKYKKGDFFIDVDKMDYGYEMVEIELMVQSEAEIPGAEKRIMNLAQEYNFPIKKLKGKFYEYTRLMKPEIFKELYNS